MKMMRWRKLALLAAPPRRWFPYADGSYYRNCPLIMGERDRVMAWPLMTPGKFAILRALDAEWDQTFGRGVQYKAQLDPGDVVTTQKPFREAFPAHPALWVLDDPGLGEPMPGGVEYRWHWDVRTGCPVTADSMEG